jgi:osmotically inducible protein OsmC
MATRAKGNDSPPGAGDLIRSASHSLLKGSAMIEKTASVHWEGPGKKGKGQISTETGALERYPYGFASRFEDDRRGTNP